MVGRGQAQAERQRDGDRIPSPQQGRQDHRPAALRVGKNKTEAQRALRRAMARGSRTHRRAVTKQKFKPLLKRAGLPEIRFHDLRHTCATLLLTRNVNPKIVSEMLGHAITLDTYSHILPNMRDQAAAMEEALS